MASRLPQAVLFDLDGTLVDTAPDLIQAINRVCADQGRRALAESDLRPFVSKGGRSMLAVAFPQMLADQRELLLAPFLAYYGQALAVHSRLYDGIAETLLALEQRGLPWGIVTNKPIGLARGVVAAFGWQDRCRVLVGGDSLPRRKPDPDQLFLACTELGIAPGDCLYVGDDERDAVAAKAAGMKAIVALWGYRGADEKPESWGADVLLDNASQLLADAVIKLS